MREFVNRKYLDIIEVPDEPKVFTLDQLAIGFEAFLLFLGVAAIVFLLEIVLNFLENHIWFYIAKRLLLLRR